MRQQQDFAGARQEIRQDFGASVLFTVFVIVAGIYGTLTASRKIFFVQVVPGALTLLFVLLAR